MLLLLNTIHCLIQEISDKHTVVHYKQLPKNTLVLIETVLYTRNDKQGMWVESDINDPNRTEVVITSSPDRDWMTLSQTGGVFNAEYNSPGSKNTFFFTSQNDTFHQFTFSLNTKYNNQHYGIDIRIYEGRAENPHAISQTDSALREVERQIKYAINACQEIENSMQLDILDEMSYNNIISQSATIMFFFILSKVIVSMIVFTYLNKRLKQFYMTNKIVNMK